MTIQKQAETPFVQVQQHRWVRSEDDGFRSPHDDSLFIRWDDIWRIAVGYEIHPIAIIDQDFWAFQTSDPRTTVWIEDHPVSYPEFTEVLRNRFSLAEPPPMSQWHDAERCIRTYVVWPEDEIGTPLYAARKPHWLSLTSQLVYANIENGD